MHMRMQRVENDVMYIASSCELLAVSDFMDVGKPPITKHFTVSPVVFLLTAEVFFLVFVSSYGMLVRVKS